MDLFQKLTGLKACNFMKKRPQHRRFHVNIAKSLRLRILKNICKRLLFDCFNGSLLQGPKGARSKLYDSIRLQRLSRRSSFLHLSRHLSSETSLDLRSNTSDESIKFLYWLFLVALDGFRLFQVVLDRFRLFQIVLARSLLQ